MFHRVTVLIVIGVLLCYGSPAFARNTEHFFDVEDAVQSRLGKERLRDIPFYFAGQEHPPIAKKISATRSNRHSSGFFRSDATACRIAVLSALIALQKKARELGGDAIVDIVSITRDKETSSPTRYRCVAGATVVHVALEGRIVRLSK